jgi:hypothetical protein
MKRSDAVLAIAECLVEPHSDEASIEAEYILNKLYKLGMISPPLLPFKGNDYYFIHAWESEDNEKK